MESIKIRNGLPKINQQTHTILMNDGWKLLKEPKTVTSATLFSIPFMFINTMITIGINYFFSSFSVKELPFITGNSFTITINFGLILLVVLFVVIHELLHLIFIPNFIKSTDTYIGLTFFGGLLAVSKKVFIHGQTGAFIVFLYKNIRLFRWLFYPFVILHEALPTVASLRFSSKTGYRSTEFVLTFL